MAKQRKTLLQINEEYGLSYKELYKITGVKAATLFNYAKGYTKPTPETLKQINEGLRAYGKDLNNVKIVL